MTQEEKDVLVREFCIRLPYKTKIQCICKDDLWEELRGELYAIDVNSLEIKYWKYQGEALQIGDGGRLFRYGNARYLPYLIPISETMNFVSSVKKFTMMTDIERYHFYLKNHIDCDGLIERGFAYKAPDGMYDIKEQI